MGGNVAVNYKQLGISEQDWNKLSPKTQAFCNQGDGYAKSVARLLSKGYDIEAINKHFDAQPVKGMSVEKGDGKSTVPDKDLTPEELDARKKDNLEALRQTALKTTPEMMDDKDMRKMNEEQWEQYFTERYKQNPAEARRDIVQVMCAKEVRQVKAGLQSMMKDTKANIQLKTKYLAEGFATEEEKKRYEARRNELRELYMNGPRRKYDEEISKLQDDLALLDTNDETGKAAINAKIKDAQERRAKACDLAALDAYNALRPPHEKVQEKDWVQQGEHLTTAQIEAIIDLKATDAFDVTEGKIEEMAIHAVSEQHFNKGVAEVKKMRDEIDKLKKENVTPEVQRIQNKAIATDNAYQDQINKLLGEAETAESRNLRQEAEIKNRETRAEIARLRKEGKDAEAEALDKQRIANKADAQKAIAAAMDQDKLKQAEDLNKERQEAREAASKEAYDALPQKVKEKIAKIEKKIQKTMDEANTDNNKFLTDNLDDIAKIMAETQIHKQRAENKFNKTVVNYDKLDKDIKEWIQETPEDFFEPADEKTANYTQEVPVKDEKGRQVFDKDGNPVTEKKYWKFSSDKFKNEMLAYSNDNNLDNDEATDATHNADYRADLQDRKKITRNRKGEEAKHKFGDRKFAAKCFKAAGIETEGDRTVGLRLAHIGKAMAKGFVAGSAAGLLAEYLSTTKVVESKFFQLVQYSGSVPWSKMVHYSKTVSGTEQYHQQVVAEGDVTSYVEFGYEGDKDWHYEGDHSYSGTGIAHGEYSGNATGTVQQTHTDWQNGIPIGEYTQDVEVKLPYSGSIDIPYGYEGTIHVSADGTVHYEGTVGGNVTQHYRQVIDVNGEVHWEAVVEDDIEVSGEAEYSGEKEVSGTTRGRAKINMKNVLGLGIAGAVSAGIASIPDALKITDEGMRSETIKRQVLSDKGVDDRRPVPPPPPPKPTKEVEPEEKVSPTEPPEDNTDPVTTVKDKFDAEVNQHDGEEIQPQEFNIGIRKTGRQIRGKDGKLHDEYEAHLWPSLYNAYGIKKEDQKQFQKEYRQKVLGGKAYFTGKTQRIEPTFNFKGVDLPFDKAAFEATPKDKYYMAAGVSSANSNAEAKRGKPTYTASTTYTLGNGTTKTIKTQEKFTDPQKAKAYLKAQIMTDPALNDKQKAEALSKIDAAEVKPKK